MLNLSEFRRRPRLLADYIPWACLVGPGLVLNKDGSVQRTLRYRGPDLESAGPEELVAFHARINNILRRFGSGWAIYLEAARRASPAYPPAEFADPAAWLVDEERRAAFETGGRHHETHCYLTFAWMPPADRSRRAEGLLINDPADAPRAFWTDHEVYFRRQTGQAFDLLEGLMPEAAWLGDSETLTYLHAAISVKRHPVAVPHVPAELDAVLYDSPLAGGLAPRLGGKALRTISVNGFPGTTEPGLLAELDGLGFAYRWVTRFLPLSTPEAERELKRLRRELFARRKSVFMMFREMLENEPSLLVNTDAENKAADADAALQVLGAGLVSFGYLTTAVTLFHEDEAAADAQAREIERVFNARGFTTILEDVNAVDAWLGTVPGLPYANVRKSLVSSLNLGHMAPLASVWAGPADNPHLGGPPLIMARSSSGTPFRVSLHHGDVGHAMIVGPTGAGKSVLLALMALQFRRYRGARVFVFDKGRSARAALLAMGGAAYDLSLSGRLSFQPLSRIDEAAGMSFAHDWVLGLLEQEGTGLTPAIRDAVWGALASLAATPVRQRTLTGLAALLQSGPLRLALQPYTLEGPYGALLDADTDDLAEGDAAVFEMEALMQAPRLAAPVLAYLFHRLEARFDGAPTLLVLDEAWVFLDHPMFAARLREWLKTLRKKNVSVVFATQSLADISASTIAPALIESCPSRIFLPNARAMEPGQAEAYDAFGLSPRQVELISRAAPKRDYYLQCPAGNRLFELDLGPVALAFCAAGSKTDQAAIEAVRGAGAGFAPAWLTARGLGWAADLIRGSEEEALACAAE